MDFTPLFTSIKLALAVTVILLCICLPLAYWNVRTKKWLAFIVESLIILPMVLPPAVLGFYLLWFFSPLHGCGKILAEVFHVRLIFSFPGLVVASCLAGLPFMFQPLAGSLRRMDANVIAASYVLGKSRWETFFRIVLPGIKPSLISGSILTFMHAIGEFGLVLMIGGSLAGQTKTVSIELYERIEAFDFQGASWWALGLFSISFIAMLVINFLAKEDMKGYAEL